jgi:hypothetical protein
MAMSAQLAKTPTATPAYQQYGDVRPASEDPYGDPAYQQYGDVLPASQDPYGDPADYQGAGSGYGQFGDVLPASQDPYGDPADSEDASYGNSVMFFPLAKTLTVTPLIRKIIKLKHNCGHRL